MFHPRSPLPCLHRPEVACIVLLVLAGLGPSLASTPASRPTPLDVAPSGRPGFEPVDAARAGIHFTNRLAPEAAARNQNLMNGSGVAAGDFDGDGRCDLFFSSLGGTNALYRNLGQWRFENVTASAGLAGDRFAGTGATFADLDGDADLDLLVATLGNGVQCYRNAGAGRFEKATDASGLASTAGSTSFALGDVDGDGDVDVYVVNYGAESVLRSGGKAEIRKANDGWVVTGPNAHRLRFVDGQIEEVGEAGYLYLNDGKGRFRAVPWDSDAFIGVDGRPKPPPLDYGLGAQMRDVNGDGAPDLYVCNDFQMPDRLWVNDGRGRFREAPFPVLRKFSFSSMGVDFADLDRDGNLDFFVVEMASREHARTLRQVSGARPLPNLPGRFDLRPQVLRNTLFRSNGDGTWSEIAEFAGLGATDWSWQPVFLDVDLDGFEDLLIANGMMFDTQDRDTLARVQSLGRQSPEAARTNLFLYPPFPSPNVAFRNRGRFSFEDTSKAWNFDSTRISQGIALADLDDDGDADVAVNCLNDGPLLYRNVASAPRLAVRVRGRAPNTQGLGARIRVEGGPVAQTQEIVAGGRYLSGDDPFRTFACGSATRLTVHVTWRSGRTTTLADVPPNHRVVVDESLEAETSDEGALRTPPDSARPSAPWFVDASAEIRHQHTEPVFDDFARQPLLHKQLSTLGPAVAWMDLDGDGADELVVGTGRGGKLGVFRFGGPGPAGPLDSDWTAPDDVAGFTGWHSESTGPSLLAAVTGYEDPTLATPRIVEIRWDRERGRLRIEPRPDIPTPGAALGPLAASDFDGDGDLDLFVGARSIPGAYPRSAPSLLLRREPGGLRPDPSAEPLLRGVGMVSAAVWSDLENDGYPELLLACEWGPIRVFRNERGRLSAWDPSLQPSAAGQPGGPLSSFTGWWNAVTTGDFDNDGRPDIAASNWGLNTGYRASAERPLRLHYVPLSAPPVEDLIESFIAPESDREVPRRSLNALGRALPFLAGRFPSHRAYAEASVGDLLEILPAPASTVQAKTLASMLFLNRAQGWVTVPLPDEAQYAPAFGLTAADVNGDGNLDLFLAQNFSAMRIEWPRCDAGKGLWLRGDGTGRFVPLSALESGVRILGDQRGCATTDIDIDGRPDLVVGQNGAMTTLWRNPTSAPGLLFELTGPPGNPSGYGATLRALDSSSAEVGPTLEIRASTGYGSKDGGRCIFSGPRRPTQLQVRWPGGIEERVPVPPTGTLVRHAFRPGR